MHYLGKASRVGWVDLEKGVHQDRAWLLNAMGKIQEQVEKVRQAESKSGEKYAIETEVHELLSLFDEEILNHLGDED